MTIPRRKMNPHPKSERDQLIDWLDLFSVKKGEEFTLASGQKSNVYVDVKKTAMHERGIKLVANLLLEKMLQEFSPVEAVAGVVLGGCHLASIVAMVHPIGIDVVYVRKEVKDHGTKNLIEGAQHTWLQHVVLLEDVVTTGQSAIQAAHALREAKFDVRGILAVVDRRADKKPYLAGEYKFASLVNFEELHP
jgi:orotate phosphoribosyltransferase